MFWKNYFRYVIEALLFITCCVMFTCLLALWFGFGFIVAYFIIGIFGVYSLWINIIIAGIIVLLTFPFFKYIGDQIIDFFITVEDEIT